MKKAEAISILATSVRPREAKDRARYDEAVKMAIEALKCSETPKSSERAAESAQNASSCARENDVIFRQAAIDIERNATVDTNPSHFEAHQKFTQFMDDAEISSFGRWQWSNGFNTALTAVGIDLKKLPSAQPDHNADIGKKVEGDCISRQAAIDALGLSEKTRKYGGDHSGYDTRMLYEIQDTLEDLPVVKPEIIRCKDCKYMIDTGDDLMCDNAKGWVVATASDFGCVLAERRTDD